MGPDGLRAYFRPGFTLIELCVVLLIGGITVSVLMGVMQRELRRAQGYASRLAEAEALRISSTVLNTELRWLDPRLELLGVGDDSVALRTVRGTGVVCDTAGDGLRVIYQGRRMPQPDKDSVIVVLQGEDTVPLSLLTSSLSRSTGVPACSVPESGRLYHWRLPRDVPPGALLLLFETGSYHLSGRALRYRSGGAGRQPLTPEIFQDARIGFTAVDAAGQPTNGIDGTAALIVRLATSRGGGGSANGMLPPMQVRIVIPNQGKR